jgi:phenylpyruvate tautomerase PptA (4-oxalocrotonate tautomerase family)
MAQVKIFGLKTQLDPIRKELSDAIHSAVVEALAYPPEKRFHRFVGLSNEDFIYPPDRSDRYIILEISLFEGRSVEAKKSLIRALYLHIVKATGITAQDIEITLFETPRHNWGIRGVPGDELNLNYKVSV